MDVIGDWQQKLADTFSANGIVGANLIDVLRCEDEYAKGVCRYHGYNTLAHSLLSFYYDTVLNKASPQLRQIKAKYPTEYYCPIFMECVTAFRILRASEILLYHGYPWSSMPLLRELKDRAIMFSGIMQGITTYSRLFGLEAFLANKSIPRDEADKKIRLQRQEEERELRRLMTGTKSGLTVEAQRRLAQWQETFDHEVHGARNSSAIELEEWRKGNAPCPIAPVPNDLSMGFYMNRCGEVGWMLLRTLPILQLGPCGFGSAWAERWHILDDSFRFFVNSLNLAKSPLGPAMIMFVDCKFPFTPDACYVESAPAE